MQDNAGVHGSRQATILIVPGLRDHVEDHWQTHLERRLSSARRVVTVPPLDADKLSRSARVAAIQRSIENIEGPILAVAHSAGVVMLVHWAHQHGAGAIQGALLATPPDFGLPLPQGYPALDVLQANGWLPVPQHALPFRSVVAASNNDPLASLDRVIRMAKHWGSEVVNLGSVGHLNPASGFGEWPFAEQLIQSLEA
ncbi:alpha/beta hydrolase [Variovorax sp. J22R133]|uniref:RBBP9/YdeN family alpha/beta hydrolase n=1 Tax=Variovorax brevis TaxID=3053503 RepID=UPI002574AA9E|nr:alpha/beta hydrolase [Variovorax sp. J22R133]MDM0111233.1 alpha/beta hydrolase [Variovorax sp. J22R133]